MKTLGPQVTMADLQEALPHQMRMARLFVTGQELKEICREVFTKAELLKNQAIKGMGFRGKVFGELITGNFAYKNGNLLYNSRVVDSNEKFSLVLVDQYYFLLTSLQSRKRKSRFFFQICLGNLWPSI